MSTRKMWAWMAMLAASASGAAERPQAASLVAHDGDTPSGNGRLKAVMRTARDLPDQTLYLPARVPAGMRLPIVAWGNGGCINVGNRYRRFLTTVASHGYLVIAIGRVGARSVEEEKGEGMPPSPAMTNGPPLSDSSQLTQAIDWAVAQNSRPGSPLLNKVDVRHVAVMGHSCGGLQAIAAADDPRVTTTLVMNSGVWSKGPGGLPGARVTKASLAKLHGSVAYFSGDASDPASENSRDDFGRLNGIPAIWAYRTGVNHGGTYFEPGGGAYGDIVIDWLQWRFRNDRRAARRFSGASCDLCRDPAWHVQRKLIP